MACPYIDCGEPRCERILRIEHLEYVMTICGDNFEACPIYQEQLARQHDAKRAPLPLRRCA